MKYQIILLFALVVFSAYAFKSRAQTKVEAKVQAKQHDEDLWDAWFGAWEDASEECEHLLPEEWLEDDWRRRLQVTSRLQTKAKQGGDEWWGEWEDYIDCTDEFMAAWEEEHGTPWDSWFEEDDWEDEEWEDTWEDCAEDEDCDDWRRRR